jgi:ATP:ADP antiporter, AAA family
VNQERKKTLLFSLSACLVSASYAILRSLKIPIFFHLVGKRYYLSSKFLVLLISIPLMFGYSKMVDKLRKDKIFCAMARIYAIICGIFFFLFFYLSANLHSLQASASNIQGWLFLGIMDLYPTFVIGGLWAFINSTSSIQYAKKNYGIITAFVKVGGILASGVSLITIHFSKSLPVLGLASEYSLISFLILLSSFMIWLSLLPIQASMQFIDNQELKKQSSSIIKPPCEGFLSGIKIITTNPYVFGIFMLFFFYEASFTVIEFQSLLLIPEGIKPMADTQFLVTFASQTIGLLIASFITPVILKRFRMSWALMITPIIIFLVMIGFYLTPGASMAVATLIIIPAIHFGLNTPTREMLFIPTTKDVQFKSKAWIDSLGRMLSKSSGLSINELIISFYGLGQSMIFMANSLFLSTLLFFWGFVCVFMGKKYSTLTIKNRKILPK